MTATSHIFDYRPRPPPRSERPHLAELICDGRAGDLLYCLGQRIGDEYDDVVCELVDSSGADRTLLRCKASKHSYVTRLPELAPGVYKVQMRVEGEVGPSNALDLEILLPGSPPATPDHVPATPTHETSPMRDEDCTMETKLDPANEGEMELEQHGSQFAVWGASPVPVSPIPPSGMAAAVGPCSVAVGDTDPDDLLDWLSQNEDFSTLLACT